MASIDDIDNPYGGSEYTPNAPDPWAAIRQSYQTHLGREGSLPEWQSHWGNAAFDDTIANSAEARARRTPTTNPNAAGPFDYGLFGQKWRELTAGRSGRNEDFDALWPELQALFPEISRFGSKNDKVQLPGNQWFDAILSSGEGGRGYNEFNPQMMGAGGGEGSGNQSTELYVNELLSRLGSLRQAPADPLRPLYELMSLSRFNELGGRPYTEGEDAALRTRYMEPLTQARDADLQMAKERAGARGFLPSSGLLRSMERDATQGYERNVAAASNEMATRAIDERQRRQDQQLSILEDLLGFGDQRRNEQENREREILDVAALLPQLDERRLQLLLQASGEGAQAGGQSTVGLANLLGLGQRQNEAGAANRRIDSEAFGEYLASLLELL